MKNRKVEIVMIAVAMVAGFFCARLLADITETPEPAVVTADPIFGPLHHIYAVRTRGEKLEPWHYAFKGNGPITDLEHQPVQATFSDYPGCLYLKIEFDRNQNRGLRWKDNKGVDNTVSSMSENIEVLACSNPIAAFETMVAPRD